MKANKTQVILNRFVLIKWCSVLSLTQLHTFIQLSFLCITLTNLDTHTHTLMDGWMDQEQLGVPYLAQGYPAMQTGRVQHQSFI